MTLSCTKGISKLPDCCIRILEILFIIINDPEFHLNILSNSQTVSVFLSHVHLHLIIARVKKNIRPNVCAESHVSGQ